MKAVVYERYGAPEVLQVTEVAQPEPRAGEVRVRIRAVEATKGDCELRAMRFPVTWFVWALRMVWGVWRPRASRRVLGGYFAGEIDACGAGVTRFAVGDRVLGCARLRMGAYAEAAVYPETYTIARLPERVGFAAGAASLLGGLNALHFLNLGAVSAGDDLLVVGAGGSIGLMAIQIAKARGAVVTAVDRTAKEGLVRAAGADAFIDADREDWVAGGARFDAIFSMPVAVPLAACLAAVKPGGRVMLGNPRLGDLLWSGFSKPGKAQGKRVHVAFAGETQAELNALVELMTAGTVRPLVDRVLPLERAAEAHRLVETEARLGAVVLSPDG